MHVFSASTSAATAESRQGQIGFQAELRHWLSELSADLLVMGFEERAARLDMHHPWREHIPSE